MPSNIPLYAATANGREEAAETLLEFGAKCHDIFITENESRVRLAIENGHGDMCKRLAHAGWTCFEHVDYKASPPVASLAQAGP